jgi:hypothetical protein
MSGVEGRLQVGEVKDATRRGSTCTTIIVSVGTDPCAGRGVALWSGNPPLELREELSLEGVT